jgi:predicted nucleic acid-binding protein
MVAVADTSPINYLVLIGQIDILPRLYARIAIPSAVLDELKHPVAPEPVRNWAKQPPEVVTPRNVVAIARLNVGETEAIALAAEMHADVLLIDEQAGRQDAVRRGLKVAGTLSVLDEADQAGFVNFDGAAASLRQTSFRVSQAVLAQIHERRAH